ncbi:hypothetical protein EniLVp02_0166 [Vibrio phage EniLVp02]
MGKSKSLTTTHLPKLSYAQVINLVRNAYAEDVSAIKRPTNGDVIWKLSCRIAGEVRAHGFHSNPYTFATLIVEDMLANEGMLAAFGVQPTFVKPESTGRSIDEIIQSLVVQGRRLPTSLK